MHHLSPSYGMTPDDLKRARRDLESAFDSMENAARTLTTAVAEYQHEHDGEVPPFPCPPNDPRYAKFYAVTTDAHVRLRQAEDDRDSAKMRIKDAEGALNKLSALK